MRFLGVPTINIGTRQFKRARGENVIDVTYKKSEILKAYESITKRKNQIPLKSMVAVMLVRTLLKSYQVELISHKTISY